MENKTLEHKSKLKTLVERFEKGHRDYSNKDYVEAQLRTDFINNFFEILGWDIDNKKGLAQNIREVIQEPTFETESERKNPDYSFRVAGEIKFYVEAKKVSIDITNNKSAIYQLKSYGWSGRLPISILTNFEYLVIYETKKMPKEEDEPYKYRFKKYHYTEYLSKFEEIYEYLSRESCFQGKFDEHFKIEFEKKGEDTVDNHFLDQITNWRILLAEDILKNNEIESEQINYLIQNFLNRLVFLRICEDKNLEDYKTLLNLDVDKSYAHLLDLFKKADSKYNSGLFDFEKDKLSLTIIISNKTIIDIVKDLYYPNSPYFFSIIDLSILSSIYEKFLTQKIVIEEDSIKLLDKPEIAHDKGIVPTPIYIIDKIIKKTIKVKIDGKSPNEIKEIKICDISCGSGTFLVRAYKYLLDYHLNWYYSKDRTQYKNKIYQNGSTWKLSLEEKKRILLNNIYGVDIDEEAIEVTKFNLLLKLLDGENNSSIGFKNSKDKLKALPPLEYNLKVGNSLIDDNLYNYKSASKLTEEEISYLKPFNWNKQFQQIFQNGGFDIIIGNPPYTRIQIMKKSFQLELDYFQSKHSIYKSKKKNFDKYYLFMERGIELLNENGLLGFIIPRKFMHSDSANELRGLISEGEHIQSIIDFGCEQVFPGKLTYTIILILSKKKSPNFKYELVPDIDQWKLNLIQNIEEHNSSELDSNFWVFLTKELKQLKDKLERLPTKLSDITDIFVGLQTSADDIYVINPIKEEDEYVWFKDKKGNTKKIEKDITKLGIYNLKLQPFLNIKSNSRYIFPYEMENDTPRLYHILTLVNKYKFAYRYLIEYHKELKKRSINSKIWYDYGRRQSLHRFNGKEKIIVKVLSKKPCFSFDEGNNYFTGGGNGPYYGISLKENSDVSIMFLLGLLNSSLISLFVCNQFQGEYFSYGKQYIESFPIPDIKFQDENFIKIYGKIENVVSKIITGIDELNKEILPLNIEIKLRYLDSLKDELNNLVYQLYNISEIEKKHLDSFIIEDYNEQ